MRRTTSQNVLFVLLAVAVAMIFSASLLTPAAAFSNIKAARSQETRRDSGHNPNLILLKRGAIDTLARRDLDTARADLELAGQLRAESSIARTRIIQLAGPIKNRWVERIRLTGARIIAYIPNNAYIIRGSASALASIAALDAGADADDTRPVRWVGALQPIEKLDTAFTDERLATDAPVDVEIEMVDSPETAEAIERINRAALDISQEPRKFLNYIELRVRARADDLLEMAALDEVLFIGPAPEMKLHDERSAQIIASNLSQDGAQPAEPGYLAWLASKGLNAPPDFLIDFTDTGLDRGSSSDFLLHPDFLDSQGHSRVQYLFDYSREGRTDDRAGHGSLVASIAVGIGGADRKDDEGFMYGLGVDPAARIGASRIFDSNGKLAFLLNLADVVSTAYQAGARISNNSWGQGGNSYDITAQRYDAFVRDAQPNVPGNQEMTFIFSAGNNGAGGHISSPGLAKNVISVAASENYRPEGFDSCDLDGEGAIGPEGANSAMDILRYSSGGPTLDGRAKPDISAPGTHIFGAASQAQFFNAAGLCPGNTIYQPPGQRYYTWSSGTSLAAPHITGAASLTRKFFISRNLLGNASAPSPAMIKAFLTNSASYLTGENASGDLPSERQGWGRVDLARAFDGASRQLVDQTRLFTETGQTYEIEGSIADRNLPVRVTLAWTDAPGALVGPATVNDLDLELIVGGVTIYRGNVFMGPVSVEGGEADRLNNLESIFLSPQMIPQGSQGNFRIRVRAANIAGDAVPGNASDFDQDFALVIYNIANPVIDPPPPPVKVPAISVATYVKKRLTITGKEFTAAARVEINGKIVERDFEFDTATNSLGIKLKAKKLNLKSDSENQIVLIENNERSQVYLLRL